MKSELAKLNKTDIDLITEAENQIAGECHKKVVLIAYSAE